MEPKADLKLNKKIKILFRHRSMEMGGVEKVMLSLLHNLNPEKFEMTVLLSLNQGELRDEFPANVRKVYLADGKEDFSKNKLIQKFQLFLRKRKLEKLKKNPEIIDKEILKENYDIEIAMTYNDFEPVLNSSNKNSKKVGWFHSEIQVPKLQPLVPKILEHFPQFHYMIYCSEKIKNLMHEHYPNLNYPKESVIINAIPLEEIKQKANADFLLPNAESKIFVSVGRLHTRKGYHKLMDAHKKLLNEGFQHTVIIIGDGEELPNLLEQQKNLGVQKSFVFAGNQMNPYPFIKNADFFIMPSESEAWPLVISEALILQKPIIATRVGDIDLMIADGKTGHLIRYETSEIYEAMKKFLTDKTFVQNIKENLIYIDKQFDNQKIFDAVEEIIINLAKKITMILLYRILLKILDICQNMVKIATIEVAKSKGMKVGKNFFVQGIPNFGSEPFLIEIGDHVTIAENVGFINHGGDARVTKRIERYKNGRNFGRIRIGNNSFIGKGSVIMPGVSIGNNCIIGSLSIVSSSVPDNTVYAGNPAKFICTIDEYGDKLLLNTTQYPLDLEADRKKLEKYLIANLPHTYKPIKNSTGK